MKLARDALAAPRQERRLLDRVRKQPDAAGEVVRIDIVDEIAAHFGDRGGVGRDARRAVDQTFADRQAPPLDMAGEDREQALLVDGVELAVGEIVDDVDLPVEEIGVVEDLEQVVDLPALAADEDEVGNLDPRRLHLDPRLHDIEVVLASLNGRDIGDERPAIELGDELRR